MPSELETTMTSECRNWARSTRVYGAAYVIVRIYLIAASAVVAAFTASGNATASGNRGWLSALAVLVTIATALDTWIKPQKKWQGFMEDRDDLQSLLSQLKDGGGAAGAGAAADRIESVRQQFEALRVRHRKENVF